MGKPLAETPELWREASPLFRVDQRAAPFLIFHGTVDPLVPLDQSQRLDAKLRETGIESKLVIFEGEGHGFKQPANQGRLGVDSLAFLKRHLGG
jgi:dipeptidyl aminopeptidase/acylaminoacyl peptidase